MDNFFKKIADILEAESVKETDDLKEFAQWDSLSVLVIISMVETDYGINLQAVELKRAKTAGDLWNAVQSKKSLQT